MVITVLNRQGNLSPLNPVDPNVGNLLVDVNSTLNPCEMARLVIEVRITVVSEDIATIFRVAFSCARNTVHVSGKVMLGCNWLPFFPITAVSDACSSLSSSDLISGLILNGTPNPGQAPKFLQALANKKP